MIWISDIQQLVNSWQERLDSPVQPSSYKDALSECIYDLNKLINDKLIEEMTEQDAKDYLASQDADYYNSLDYAEAM